MNYKEKIKKLRRKVDKIYNNKTCIIGNINKNYIQIIPILKIYHLNNKKEICVFEYKEKMNKNIICPNCKENILLSLDTNNERR